MNKAGASTLVFQLAYEPFKVPGDSGFALGGLLTPAVDKQEEGNQSTAGFAPHARYHCLAPYLCTAYVQGQ